MKTITELQVIAEPKMKVNKRKVPLLNQIKANVSFAKKEKINLNSHDELGRINKILTKINPSQKQNSKTS